ncbi:autoinducer binding domain-containing protein [Ancylobacter sp. IITR112]|uniref:autoinducer binding domain-containing protein n=1 Tax=Ancylobacter sp. IITR112 TaxID=3138073 RepID=UPI00352B1C20
MRTWFQRLTDVSSLAQTEQTLKEALAELVQDLGFDCYAYLNVQPVRIFAVSNYAPEWQARYLTENYTKIDPVISMAKEQMKAFAWAAGPPRSLSKSLRRFYSEAGDFRIRSGISIPVRAAFGHMSMLTLASHKPSLCLDTDIDQIAAVTAVAQLHAKMEQQDAEPTASVEIDLKAKQALCLKWSAEGKTMKDIASIEGMRWSPFAGHFGGFAKLGSGVCHAALLMPSQAMWTSSGVLPPRAEWGLVRL